jgi:hypothetical protein
MASEFIPGLEADTNSKGEIACDVGNVHVISLPSSLSNTEHESKGKKLQILAMKDFCCTMCCRLKKINL